MNHGQFSSFIPEASPDIPLGLPRAVRSLCPECLITIPATLEEQSGQVWMKKTCPQHGPFEELIASSAPLFRRLERYAFDDSVKLAETPGGDPSACPSGCGICSGHLSSASMTNLDLTNRCNLRCPTCFANSAVQSYVYEPALGQIREMMDRALAIRPKRLQYIQFSGGEPTLSPHFFAAGRLAKERGIRLIQAATNGILFARDPTFAQRAADAGLNGAYLQFDGVTDDAYEVTRGVKGLWEIKLQAIEAMRKAGIRVTLVPTILRGINDHQVGDILKFAAANMDAVVAIAFQPVSFTGRVEPIERRARRYTLTDLAFDVEAQTGMLKAMEDWWPLNIVTPFARIVESVTGTDSNGFHPFHCNSHPDCGVSSYLLINPATGQSVPLSQLFDIEQLLKDVHALACQTERFPSRIYATARLLHMILKDYRPENEPRGLTLTKLAKTVDAISGGRLMAITKERRHEWRLLLVTAMHFQDAYNYQVERVQRCTIHYSAPDGHIYPFCTYNCGHNFRDRIETRYSVPKEQWFETKGALAAK